ncbi:MAG: tetratricopeptide repeat protein [Polyangiaceae bacterium]|nr:tetratricopeptide repeat protein [Polyangiaceae bacterium]
MARSSLSAVLVAAAAVSLAACGGSKQKPNASFAPTPGAMGTAPPQAAVASAPDGQQVGISDGSPDGAPKMSASARTSYDKGMALWQGGDLKGAVAAFTEATQADPKAHQAFYSLGVMQERLGDPAALASYRQSWSLVDTYEPAIVAYGLLLAKRGSLQEADDFLTDKKGKMPDSAPVLAALAEVKSLKKDTASAQVLAQDALKKNPDYRPAMMVLARDHYRARRIDLALYALGAILDGMGSTPEEKQANPPRDKNSAEGHLLRAVIYREQGKRAAAIDEYKTVVQLRPDIVAARVQLGAYLLEAGNAEEAQPLLEGALKYDATQVQAHLNLGDAYRILGRGADAKRELDWVLAKDPNMPQVHYSLGLLYLFSKSLPGMDEKAQLSAAVASLEKFQALRGQPTKGQTDDSDQLILRAKVRLEALDAAAKAAAAPPPAPPPAASGSTAPAGSAAPPP